MGFRKILVGFAASVGLSFGLFGAAAVASPNSPVVTSQVNEASAATYNVKVKNNKRSYTGAIVHEVRNGWVVKNGVTVEPGRTGAFTQRTGPGTDGCTLYMPAGARAKVYRTTLTGVYNAKQIVNKSHYGKNMYLKKGSCKGSWSILLQRGARLV